MKKRLILCLVTIFSLFIMIFTLSGCSNNAGNQNADLANFVSGTTPFETLETFVTKFPDRTSTQSNNSDPSKDAALWIAEQFASFGYDTHYNKGADTEGLDIFTYNNQVTSKMETAYNVVFKKESASEKTVVVAAHYDNVYDIKVNNQQLATDGTYNNGTGVATLIETARVLKDIDLPFDVIFVAFAAEEFGWYGSERFLSNYVDKENIMLMINFDRNAIGDYVYMYSSEAKTKHNKFFYDIVRDNNLCIADLPSFRAPALTPVPSNSYFSNEANWADSDLFLAEGINIVNFISMNFTPFGVEEIKGQDSIAYTKNDTFDNIVLRLGGGDLAKQKIDKQINSAVSVVVYAMQDENFVNVMTTSKANNGMDTFASFKVISIIAYSLIGVAIVVLLVCYFVVGKTAKTHDIYIDTIYGRINKNTGKVENSVNKECNKGDNTGNIFGNEFDNKNSNNAANSNNTNGKNNRDKTNDIFGDF